MDEVLWFLGECWKDLGRPEQVQFDNARELSGWGPAARTLSRVIRLCLRFGVSPVFIPAGEPQFNGSVENFNGWFQEPLFDRRFQRPGDLRRELARLQEAVNTQHAHPRLGGKTPAQHRRGLRLQKLPTSFEVPTGKLPLAAGRVTFIRRVSVAGTVTRTQPIVPSGQEASGAVPAAGGGHQAWVADGVPQRPRPEALAVQATERLSDI